MKFNLTYDIVTRESSERGDFAYNGYVTRTGGTPLRRNYIPDRPAAFSLRKAIAILTGPGGTVTADSCPVSFECPPRWFNCGGDTDWRTGHSTTLALHLPKSVTPSSAIRIARLLKCYGVSKSPSL